MLPKKDIIKEWYTYANYTLIKIMAIILLSFTILQSVDI